MHEGSAQSSGLRPDAPLSELYRAALAAFRDARSRLNGPEECQEAAARAVRKQLPTLSPKEAGALALRIIAQAYALGLERPFDQE